jgi:hypothetical protein
MTSIDIQYSMINTSKLKLNYTIYNIILLYNATVSPHKLNDSKHFYQALYYQKSEVGSYI